MLHFITGDRAVPAPYAIPAVAMLMLKIMSDDPGATFATGDNQGVESAVSLVALTAGIELPTVIESPRTEAGKVDWDARHAAVLADPNVKIHFVHSEPLSSHIGASLLAFADSGRVDFVS